MNSATQSQQWLETFRQSLARHAIDSSDCFGQLRVNAISALQAEPVPFRKIERWRYTPVDRLFKLPLNLATPEPANDCDFSHLFTPHTDAFRFVIVNGRASFLGSETELPAGVTFTTMQQGRTRHARLLSRYAGSVMARQDTDNAIPPVANRDSRLFEYLNQSVSADGFFLHLAAGVKLSKPVEVVFVKTGEQAELVQTHNLVVLESKAHMTLLEKHVDEQTVTSFSNHQLEIAIGEQASLDHYYLQQQQAASCYREGMYRLQASGSRYAGWFGCCGSQWSRLEMNVWFTGEHATSEVQGIQLATNGQVNDIHLDIRHDKPHCQSEQHFRGLVAKNSKIVFDGNITVSKHAQKTLANLSDNNLMLTRNAEVDAKPQLEIYADDVQCSHGTSIGELDEQQLFYLKSRGIAEEQARRLLSIGFVAQLIDNIEMAAFRQQMLDLLERQLQAVNLQGGAGDSH